MANYDSKWMKKAREEFGLSKSGVKRLMRQTGIKDLDSKNDIRAMRRTYQANQSNSGGSSSGGSSSGGSSSGGSSSGGGNNDAYSSLVDQYNNLYANYTDATNRAQNAQNALNEYKSTVSDFESQLANYKGQVGTLTTQYQNALSDVKNVTKERDDYQKQFTEQSALYEQAKAEADTYREQAVGQQLSGLRSGASSGGANQTSYAGGGSLSSGRSGYRSAARDQDKEIADYVIEQGGITDSVLNREGPVVQMMNKTPAARGTPSQIRDRTSSAGTGSYYASRFGK